QPVGRWDVEWLGERCVGSRVAEPTFPQSPSRVLPFEVTVLKPHRKQPAHPVDGSEGVNSSGASALARRYLAGSGNGHGRPNVWDVVDPEHAVWAVAVGTIDPASPTVFAAPRQHCFTSLEQSGGNRLTIVRRDRTTIEGEPDDMC